MTRTYTFIGLLLLFFLFFFIYPLFFVIRQAFILDGHFSLQLFSLMFSNPSTVEAIVNSLKLGVVATIATTILTFPLALIFHRYKFPGKTLFTGLLLLPLIIPPFVGAIGFKQLLSRFGSINLLLMQMKIITEPIDWLGSAGFWGVVILETIHLYPIMFLNLSASINNLDPIYEEAAQSLGASLLHRLRTITLPLILPGYFAGAIIVFLWAMSDLGIPLIFDYSRVVPVMIFNMVGDIHSNPMGYSLVVFIIFLTLVCFLLSKWFAGGRQYELYSKGYSMPREIDLLKTENTAFAIWRKFLNPLILLGIYLFLCVLLFISILPHLGVVLTSLSDEWFMTILPEKWTFKYYPMIFSHPLAFSSIKMSLFLSSCSTIVDIFLGIVIAWLVARKKITGAKLLDILTMLTLTIPGIILAFGFVACFTDTILDPRINPIPLLIIAYALRRLPYMVRSTYAGFLQSSVTLEEASASLGANPRTTFFKITFPLIFAHVLVGSVLAFSFAMLEVSDSLILAMRENYYPITKTIWYLTGRLGDGPAIASAMGVLGMGILLVALLIASQLLGKKLGDLFRT